MMYCMQGTDILNGILVIIIVILAYMFGYVLGYRSARLENE